MDRATTTVDQRLQGRGTILGGQHGLNEEDAGRRGMLGAELGGFRMCSVMGSEISGTSLG